MSSNSRHDSATTGAGALMVGSAGMLRHAGLERAYSKTKRPPVLQELKLLKHSPGRLHYAAGAGLGLIGTPALAVGVANLTTRRKSSLTKRDGRRRKSLLAEARSGVRDSITMRNDTVSHPAPPALMAANYAGGGLIGSGAGALVHQTLGRTKFHGGARSGLAAIAGVSAGAATLPIQSKIIGRATHGKYESTPTGLRRRKKAEPITKYYGQDMTTRQKRTRVMGASGIPIVPFAGDIAAASTAASMAPPELRKKTAALQFGGAQSGGLATGAAAAYGATALSRNAHVKAGVKRLSESKGPHKKLIAAAKVPGRQIDSFVNGIRTGAGLKPKSTVNPLERVVAHGKTPRLVKGALKPLMHNPKVAVAAGVVGSTIGGQMGGYAGYGHALKLERERNNKSRDNRHGVSKRDASSMTPADTHRQAKKKRLQANISVFTGSTGVAALGAGLASKIPKLHATKWGSRLAHAQTPLLTAGAGVGGLGSFNFARYTRDEANAQDKAVRKALGLPKIPGAPRVPSIRTGTLVATRQANGTTTTATRRGGLVR